MMFPLTVGKAPYPDYKALSIAQEDLGKLFPEFNGVAVRSQWGGYMDATPDHLPVIGELESAVGLLVASGFSGHGFGLGPSAGKRIVDLATVGQAEARNRACGYPSISRNLWS